MTSAVIVSTARTPLAKSWKGAFNMTHGATLGGHAVQHAVQRAGIDPAEIDDVIMGCANPEGATGANIARQIALRAGLPITTSGVTVNRFCSSGLQTIAMAAQRITAGEADIYVAGGVESISCVQQEMNTHMMADPWLNEHKPEIYWNMLQTAEQVAKRYNISRERMDQYGAASQQKAAAALEAGRFTEEIAPITVTAGVADAVMGLRSKEVTVSNDEGIRPGTTYEGICNIRTAIPGGVISAGNASQFSDGGGACVVMSETVAERKGLKPLGRFLGLGLGCFPLRLGHRRELGEAAAALVVAHLVDVVDEEQAEGGLDRRGARLLRGGREHGHRQAAEAEAEGVAAGGAGHGEAPVGWSARTMCEGVEGSKRFSPPSSALACGSAEDDGV